MPKAKTGNFTLRTLADSLTAEKCTHRFTALQRSGQYSELRIIGRGKKFRIVGYKWPGKTTRRKLNIGNARKNPNMKTATDNQVYFKQYGKNKVGWINRETPTKYELTFKVGESTRTVLRPKNKVMFVKTGKKGKIKKNPTGKCSATKNPTKALQEAIHLSREFHGLEPRKVRNIKFEIPKSLMQIGSCSQVNYISDKFDEKIREYFHQFTNEALLFADPKPQKDGKQVLIIIGKFKIKPEGITG